MGLGNSRLETILRGNNRFWLSGVMLAGLATVGLVVACNTHPVELNRHAGAIEVIIPEQRGESSKLDILWMVDNSGSMCRSQQTLREGFSDFINILAEIDLDFHIGMTTTHMNETELEPVAKPGHLQSKIQPLPGFDPTCFHTLDAAAQPIIDDFAPVLDAIEIAVECTSDPAQHAHLLTPNSQDLRCSFYRGRPQATEWGCVAAETPTQSSFFPPTDAYRPIPKVLRAQDYRTSEGRIDIARLSADFACMSTVGTRGYGFEKGLGAVRRALDVELTGGPDCLGDLAEGESLPAECAAFPNAGFLRRDARLGVIFVTDENDCTHDGTLDEQTSCTVNECTFRENEPDSPLVPVLELKSDFMTNLQASKGNDIGEESVLVASIHGSIQRFTGEREVCGAGYMIPPSCFNLRGKAFSGHRYEAFIREFPQFFPKPANVLRPDDPLEGLICSDFTPALRQIADFFKIESGGCVTDVYRCDNADSQCPSFPYTGDPGTCTPYPNAGQGYYCDSGIQVRVRGSGEDLSRVEAAGYCLPDSMNTPEFRRGCTIDPARYRWAGCPGDGQGVILDWLDDQSHIVLSNLEVQIRYAKIPAE